MSENKVNNISLNIIIILSLTMLFVCLGFYYYSYRPDQIRKMCGEKATSSRGLISKMEYFQESYNECILKNGLQL